MTEADKIIKDAAKVCDDIEPKAVLVSGDDPRVIKARMLAAYRLSILWKDTDEGRVLSKLNCNMALVRLAKKRSVEQSPEGEEFRKLLAKMEHGGARPAEAAAIAPATMPETDDEAIADLRTLLLDAASVEFQVDPKDILRSVRNFAAKNARYAVAFVGATNFSMNESEIAAMFECPLHDAVQMVEHARYDFDDDVLFKRGVSEMRKRLAVVRKVKV